MQTYQKNQTETPKKDPILRKIETETLNNTEFVTQFMTWGSPMNQVWLMEAASKYAEQLVENEAEVLKGMEGGFIHGPAWIECAKKWKAEYAKNYL